MEITEGMEQTTMRPILRIYSDDISRIARNWPAAVIVLGLAVLPSLYAWFNILASWDPYSQTGGLPVAVANLDQGASLRGTAINFGNEIVDSLKENHNIGWTFTDVEQVISGLKQGDYYACIIIPQQFSARIATVLSNEPQKAELVYYVNEKINAVAPKITAKGASGIIEQVDRSFTEAANGVIFRIFNEIGVELQANLPALLALRVLHIQAGSDDTRNRTGTHHGCGQCRNGRTNRRGSSGANAANGSNGP
ncbi:YhgE/Pip domain-containing protein [Paenibacillus albidus]|uniref:YhgE/Pip domain-containing protein n=1 Tax=Paenibacillus albidus TaxID=2041023 RepID=UPI00288AC308|nr:YhgE/Pip domain-containing protein [Paenibacillus albidus]